MWSEDEIRRAASNWQSAQAAVEVAFKDAPDYQYQRGLAAGYAGALEMVLRPSPTSASVQPDRSER